MEDMSRVLILEVLGSMLKHTSTCSYINRSKFQKSDQAQRAKPQLQGFNHLANCFRNRSRTQSQKNLS